MPPPVLLVAEDNELDAVLLERMIEHCGGLFQMVRVKDGKVAIDYVRGAGAFADHTKHPVPNLLLLDLNMPQKDGFAVLRWRQENPAFARLPIIVYSSSYLPEDVERAYALGANSYVVKPADPIRLERFVRTLLYWWTDLNVMEGHE